MTAESKNRARRQTSTPTGVQSAKVAFDILRVMLDRTGPLQLREIAEGVRMAPSNVHRYLVSFVRSGVAVQDAATARYDLGPLSVRLGLSALGRIDGIDVMAAGLADLVAVTALDGHSSVWGDAGPMVLRWRGQSNGITVRVREGSVLPLMSSATGRIWASHLAAQTVKPILDLELAAASRHTGRTRARLRTEFDARLDAIREAGVEWSSGERRTGIGAISAPVFGDDGRIAFAMTLLAPVTHFEQTTESTAEQQLLQATRSLSERLGARLPLRPG
jgi:DNA-binding IclR family transcriptional regulator